MKLGREVRGSRRRRLAWAAAAYLLLLGASHAVRALSPTEVAIPAGESTVEVAAIEHDAPTAARVRIAFWDVKPAENPDAPVVVLLHGSPGTGRDMLSLAPTLAESYRVISPDLPGFGASTESVPDYSVRAHARYVVELLDALGIERAHVVAFSMGGGVGLEMADVAPDRVASLVMLSAIGVQEMELLGDYRLNHTLHGLQLAALWAIRECTPHFGLFDHTMLGRSYARNFYDTDQRPLRGVLERYSGPMLIIHGRSDPLVPVEAAVEHHRLVPQSELELLDDNHFMVFTKGRVPARAALAFFRRVDQGTATTRATAAPDRLAAASLPYDPRHAPRAKGVAALVFGLLLALLTLVSEDLTCIGAGVMAADGRISFTLAAVGCLAGIFVGDVLLFLAGRYLGRPVLARAPLRWFLRERDVERCSKWFNDRGAAAIFISRFVPGARLPTYFAAGLFDTSLAWFSFYFLIAAAVWTPALVALSMLFGGELMRASAGGGSLLTGGLLAIVATYAFLRLALRATTWRGRRMLVGQWRRLRHWEFWPPWLFYPPVVCYVLWLAVRHRGLTVFTAANPAIEDGGFVGESKAAILDGLGQRNPRVARYLLVEAWLEADERLSRATAFMAEHRLEFPVVVKPDVGQRGEGVTIARTLEALRAALAATVGDTIVQEYVPGVEFGVFYYRRPEEATGHVFAITDKRFPEVVGDGARTLEQLILGDARAVAMARTYFDLHSERLWTVPADGERIRLVELGTHCRGAVFLDGECLRTDSLEAAIDALARGYEGFYFGRFDVRAPNVDAFASATDFRVLELNAVTSEATNIYDPKNGLVDAYRILFAQWRLAFEIGAANRARGHEPIGVVPLLRRIRAFLSGERPGAAERENVALLRGGRKRHSKSAVS